MSEIEQCHRCGSNADYEEDMECVMCSICGFYISNPTMNEHEQIKYWNTRKIEDDLQRQLAEAMEIIEECLSRTSDGNFKDCIRRRIKEKGDGFNKTTKN